jgi:hypothetical protein
VSPKAVADAEHIPLAYVERIEVLLNQSADLDAPCSTRPAKMRSASSSSAIVMSLPHPNDRVVQ